MLVLIPIKTGGKRRRLSYLHMSFLSAITLTAAKYSYTLSLHGVLNRTQSFKLASGINSNISYIHIQSRANLTKHGQCDILIPPWPGHGVWRDALPLCADRLCSSSLIDERLQSLLYEDSHSCSTSGYKYCFYYTSFSITKSKRASHRAAKLSNFKTACVQDSHT